MITIKKGGLYQSRNGSVWRCVDSSDFHTFSKLVLIKNVTNGEKLAIGYEWHTRKTHYQNESSDYSIIREIPQ